MKTPRDPNPDVHELLVMNGLRCRNGSCSDRERCERHDRCLAPPPKLGPIPPPMMLDDAEGDRFLLPFLPVALLFVSIAVAAWILFGRSP